MGSQSHITKEKLYLGNDYTQYTSSCPSVTSCTLHHPTPPSKQPTLPNLIRACYIVFVHGPGLKPSQHLPVMWTLSRVSLAFVAPAAVCVCDVWVLLAAKRALLRNTKGAKPEQRSGRLCREVHGGVKRLHLWAS